MKTKTEQMYATMAPWRLFFIVALPGMISMFAMSVYSIIEGIFIGHILGEEAFAAVNIAFPLVLINFSIADLIGVGDGAAAKFLYDQRHIYVPPKRSNHDFGQRSGPLHFQFMPGTSVPRLTVRGTRN